MNRSLRKAHLRRFGLLAVLLPVGISAALMNRPTLPNASPADSGLEDKAAEQDTGALPFRRFSFAAVEGLELRLSEFNDMSHGPRDAALAVLLRTDAFTAPDVLVYWSKSSQTPTPGDELPSEVTFLGELSGLRSTTYWLPSDYWTGGALVLFSLAHGEVLDALRIESGGKDQ
ncbi:MAG: hypothetical protein ACI8TQ_001626 [Planctomycetota bacterium]|jgi:hypothetical protein